MKKSDTLYNLQRKYGTGNRAPWPQVAKEELHLPKTYVRDKAYREQFREHLGLHQLVNSQKAPWFVNLNKLAKYMESMERKRA